LIKEEVIMKFQERSVVKDNALNDGAVRGVAPPKNLRAAFRNPLSGDLVCRTLGDLVNGNVPHNSVGEFEFVGWVEVD
jgi:hypothetical protein